MTQNSNTNIGCTVTKCKYHTNDDYCSLERINVVQSTNATNAATIESTDCGSFVSNS